MKKRYLLLLSLPLLTMTSCGSTAQPNSSEEPSSIIINDTFDASMINLLASGYSASGVVSMGGESSYGGFYNQCVEVHCTESVFEYLAWSQSSLNAEATRDKLNYDIRYESCELDSVNVLAETELGLNNKINYFPVQSNGSNIRWETAGYSNVYSLFKSTDFIKTENANEFSLVMGQKKFAFVYKAVAVQLTGLIGVEAESFVVRTDGEKPISYEVKCKDVMSTSGDKMEIYIKGNFTDFGSDVVKDIEPIEGNIDNDFETALTNLRDSKNWELDVELSNKSLHIENYNNEAVIYDLFDTEGKQTGSYGYIQPEKNVVQGVTKIGDTLYYDSDELSGSVTSILPDLDISSAFFKKSEQSTENKLIYDFKDEYIDVASSTDYGMLAGSSVGSLQIVIENETITILNKLSSTIQEKFVYSNIGGVSNLLTNVNKVCDDLTWSKIASNQPEELAILLEFLPKEALDQIPTIGGKHSYIILDASYNPTKPLFNIPISDYQDGQSISTEYRAKLVENEFTKTSESKTTNGTKYVYEKDCLVNGETKTVKAEIYLLYDIYSFSARLLVYPSMN